MTSGVSLIVWRWDGVLASVVTRGAGIIARETCLESRGTGEVGWWVGVVARRAGMVARRAGMVARRAGIVARVVWVGLLRLVFHLDHCNES
jgi:hypothetical protein